jgi:hypothetical protein
MGAASAGARFSTQRFGTLYVVVATHKVDGDRGIRLLVATVVLSIVGIDLFTK